MFNKFIIFGLIAIATLTKVQAECPNACNGHGQCSSYDMCICSKDWRGKLHITVIQTSFVIDW